jgi:hypothetical protein
MDDKDAIIKTIYPQIAEPPPDRKDHPANRCSPPPRVSRKLGRTGRNISNSPQTVRTLTTVGKKPSETHQAPRSLFAA